MIIDHELRFVFIHIPKTGGDAIAQALTPIAARTKTNVIACSGVPKHFPAKRILRDHFDSDMERWQRYVRFAVNRNVWQRIHSDWHFSRKHTQKIKQHESNPVIELWVEKLKRVRDSYTSFEQFVRAEYLARPPGDGFPHYCQDETGRDLISVMLDFERLDQHFQALCRLLTIDPPPALPRVNVSESRPRYRDEYTPELADAVRRHYAYEVERFRMEF
jgi:hypothetical protein